MPIGFRDTKAMMRNKSPRLEELVEVFDFKAHPKQWIKVRFIGPVWSYYQFWMQVRKQDKSLSKDFPKLCLDWNAASEDFDSEQCPYRANLDRGSLFYVSNAIIRELQDGEPRKEKQVPRNKFESKPREMCGYDCHVKSGRDSKSWTPVRVLRIPATLADQLRSLSDSNRVISKKTGETKYYDIGHPKFGIDVEIYYAPKPGGKGGDYRVQRLERTPLTEEELNYLLWPLDVLKPEDVKTAKREWDSIKDRLVTDKSEPVKDEDDSYVLGGKDRGVDKKARSRDDEDEENDALEDIEEDSLDNDVEGLLDEEEDEQPRKKPKLKAKKKHRVA